MANEGEDEPATMKDIKEIETYLTSAMDKRMDEMREMIAKLMSMQASTPSASSAPVDTSSEKINSEDDGVENGEANKDDPLRKLHPPNGKVRRRITMRSSPMVLSQPTNPSSSY